jgi:hypothetical protein
MTKVIPRYDPSAPPGSVPYRRPRAGSNVFVQVDGCGRARAILLTTDMNRSGLARAEEKHARARTQATLQQTYSALKATLFQIAAQHY